MTLKVGKWYWTNEGDNTAERAKIIKILGDDQVILRYAWSRLYHICNVSMIIAEV